MKDLELYPICNEGITKISGGRKLTAIFGNNDDIGLGKLNEITINEVIADDGAKHFKSDDSSKKKGAFEEFLDSVDKNDPIEVDYSKGFKK